MLRSIASSEGTRNSAVACFSACVIKPLGKGRYLVREQPFQAGDRQTAGVPKAADLPAINLAELDSFGRADLEADTVVHITFVTDYQTPPTLRYVFDHPTGDAT